MISIMKLCSLLYVDCQVSRKTAQQFPAVVDQFFYSPGIVYFHSLRTHSFSLYIYILKYILKYDAESYSVAILSGSFYFHVG